MKLRREERAARSAQATSVVRVVIYRPAVEHGYEYKPTNRGRSRDWEYPYEQMDVGDSFHVPVSVTAQNILSSRISAHNKENPETRFSTAKAVNEDGEPVTRVWRIR